jgi:hypothetical protein
MLVRFLPFTLSVCLAMTSALAAPVQVLPPELRGALQPQIAVAPSGRIHVVFGKDNAIYHTTSTDGRTFSRPVKVGELEKLALKMRRGPRVAVAGQRVVVTAISHQDGMLHCWVSADEGKTWSEQAPLNSPAESAREGLHAMAGDGRGLVALTWLDLRSGSTELWNRVSRDGGRTWEPETRVYASPDGHICECCHPSVALGPKGEIAALWRNWLGGSRDMWAAVSTDGGKTFPQPQKLGTGSWPLKGCPMDGGALAYDAASGLATVWRREGTVYSAAPGAMEKKLADMAQQPVIARTRSGLAISYEKGGEIMLVVGSESPKSLGKGRAPAIASNAAGVAFLAWEAADGSSPLITPVP